MKKSIVLLCAVTSITIFSCRHRHGNTDITYKDAGPHYSMEAYFNKNKSRDVEHYLDKAIGSASNISFVNTRTDATITLDDKTKFYLQKEPGHIEIKLDKRENSDAAYRNIKSMCEGIKEVLAK